METARIVWGQRIIAARRAVDMTQVQLAAALRVTQQLISCWERGVCAPHINRRATIARILGIPGGADELFAYPTEPDDQAVA